MTGWIDAMGSDGLPEGGRWLVRKSGLEIAIFRVQGRVYAIDDSCPHNGASLAGGKLDGPTVTCRAHGLRFDLATGCMRGAPGMGVRSYPVREHGGRIEIDTTPARTAGPDPIAMK